MIKKKDHLFNLIKSLTKEEKRHFKLYAGKYRGAKENNYLRLFDAIDRLDVYDEASIKQQFKNERFIKQLTVTKHYLLKQITKSLQILHYDDAEDLRVLALLHQIAVLFKKGQYEICRDLVKKGLKICATHELFLEWIGFLKWEIDLINKLNISDYKISLSKYLEKTSQLLSWHEITTQGNHLANQLQIFSLDIPTFGSYSLHYHDFIDRIEKLIRTIDLDSLPLKTRFNLIYPLALSYLTIADYFKAFEKYMKIYEELKEVYHRKELHVQYVDTLVGLVYCSSAIKKDEIVKTTLEELRSVVEVNQHVRFKKAESLAFYPLINCALIGDFYNGLTAIEIIESFLEKFKDKVTAVQYIYAYFYSAYIYLGNNNTTVALRYLRKADASQSRDLLPNIRLGIKIMEIMIFLDQKKIDLVESRLRSLQRQLHKEENVKIFIKKFIKYFRQIISLEPDSENVTELYKRFLRELQQTSVKEQLSMFIHFDLISWLQSKIENCTFGEKIKTNSAKLFKAQEMK